jgi:ferredoxin
MSGATLYVGEDEPILEVLSGAGVFETSSCTDGICGSRGYRADARTSVILH